MLIKRPPNIPTSAITPEHLYLRRREFMHVLAAGAITGGFSSRIARADENPAPKLNMPLTKSTYSLGEKPNDWDSLTQYNNYYEFGTSKGDPARNAHRLQTKPWTVVIEGEIKKPRSFGIEELLKFGLEERIYRLRCVEAWSMVVPWVGFEFNKIARLVEPTGNAKFVEFVSAYQPENMPGTRLPVLDWPYVEGLRMDEAMHPLTIMAVGLYDRVLPNQNGAPMRLIVPWKYGFKSGKSITHIRFVEKQPKTAWEKANSREYGFYSNVNPDVDHPRWSQRSEKQLPGLFSKRKTELFNGYAAQVAQLYTGMDLRKNF